MNLVIAYYDQDGLHCLAEDGADQLNTFMHGIYPACPGGGYVLNSFAPNRPVPEITAQSICLLTKSGEVKQFSVGGVIQHELIYGINAPRYYTPAFDYNQTNTDLLYVLIDAYLCSPEGAPRLLNPRIILADEDNTILWQWSFREHLDQLNLIAKEMALAKPEGTADHECFGIINSACLLGDNKWYNAGDERFHPQNVMFSERNTSCVGIIDHQTGNIIWLLTPADYGQTIGHQHFPHLIPQGLPGAGNLLLFVNQGCGENVSRIVEMNPITKEVVWDFTNEVIYSPLMGCVQRLPDGQTLILASQQCRFVLVDADKNIMQDKVIITAGNHNLLGNSQSIYRFSVMPDEWLSEVMDWQERTLFKKWLRSRAGE